MTTRKLGRTLLVAVLALSIVLSITGGTIAWFTDEVTSAGNTIEAGTLNAEVYASDDGANWTEVTTGSDPLFNYDKWEPGYTTYKYLKIKNAGTLAFKFQLNIKADSAVTGDYKLADVIDVYKAESAPTGRDSLGDYVGTLTSLTDNTNGAAYGVLEAGDATDLCIVLKMQESADNNYQGLSIGSGFSVQLIATQYAYESDSFDSQYDAGANFSSSWDGETPAAKPNSIVVDTAKHLISINDAEGLAYLNMLVNDPSFYANYGNTWKYTIELNADINLMNKAWTPITLANFVAFEGNGHTISNLNVTGGNNVGLFGDISCNDIGVTYVRNLTIDGAYVSGNENVGVVAGASTQGALQNVTVNNATVIGTKYVGGLFGWGNGSANNCAVLNSSVTIGADGTKEAGGLIGYVSNDGNATTVNKVIAGNRVENVTVSAPTIAAGLVAQPNSSNNGGAVIVIKNNTLKNVTVTTSKDSGATAALYVSNNVNNKTVVEDNNTAENSEASSGAYGMKLVPGEDSDTIYVDSKEDLLNLSKLDADWAKLFSDGKGTTYTNYAKGAGADYYYDWNWTIKLTADIDLANAQIDPINVSKWGTFDGQGYTIKNAVIKTDATTENAAGLFNANQCSVKNVKLDNIHVTGSNVGNSTAGVLSGSCNQGVDNVTVTNSSVTGGKYTGGVVGYGYTDVTNCTLTNVTVKGGYKLGGVIGYICASGTNTGEVTGNKLTNCTVDGIGGGVYAGGKTQYIKGKVVGNYNCNGTCNNNTITNMNTTANANIGEIEAGMNVAQ